jgi:phage terminase large subunit-like protein
VHWARAWDNAATTNSTSAFTAGVRMGITLDGRILIDDIIRERLNTAERYDKQLETAEDDGFLVPVLIPNDPGSAGTDTAFQTKQMLEENHYTCLAESVTGSKEIRAQPLSLAVNSGNVYVALSEPVRKEMFKEFKNFPLSTYKDQVDAAADGYRYLYKLLKSGTVIKNYSETRNLISKDLFEEKFGSGIPKHWRLYVGCRISEDASKPSGAVIIAHAAQNSGLKDVLFIVDEYKHKSGDYYKIFEWIEKTIALLAPAVSPKIYLRTKSESIITTARAKLKLNITLFDNDITKGLPELNWFFLPRKESSPFNEDGRASGIYYLIRKENDLLSARQESLLWKYNEKGEPQDFGGVVMDSARMIASGFRTYAASYTAEEKTELTLPIELRKETLENENLSNQELGQRQLARMMKLNFEQPLRQGTLTKEESNGWWGEKFM